MSIKFQLSKINQLRGKVEETIISFPFTFSLYYLLSRLKKQMENNIKSVQSMCLLHCTQLKRKKKQNREPVLLVLKTIPKAKSLNVFKRKWVKSQHISLLFCTHEHMMFCTCNIYLFVCTSLMYTCMWKLTWKINIYSL